MRKASRRYQRTDQGRKRHAARQKRYRCKESSVTHQGRQEILLGDVLSNVTKRVPQTEKVKDVCHFCGKKCSWCVRGDCLRKYRSQYSRLSQCS